jgi:hypothetical protein
MLIEASMLIDSSARKSNISCKQIAKYVILLDTSCEKLTVSRSIKLTTSVFILIEGMAAMLIEASTGSSIVSCQKH